MISDAPYRVEAQAIPFGIGIGAGVLGGVLVFGGFMAWWRTTVGSFGSVAVYGGLGALAGLLYAACQRRAPARGVLAVGAFYGILLWVISGLLVGSILGPAARGALRSWPWAVACMSYGAFLALVTVVWQIWHPVHPVSPALKD